MLAQTIALILVASMSQLLVVSGEHSLDVKVVRDELIELNKFLNNALVSDSSPQNNLLAALKEQDAAAATIGNQQQPGLQKAINHLIRLGLAKQCNLELVDSLVYLMAPTYLYAGARISHVLKSLYTPGLHTDCLNKLELFNVQLRSKMDEKRIAPLERHLSLNRSSQTGKLEVAGKFNAHFFLQRLKVAFCELVNESKSSTKEAGQIQSTIGFTREAFETLLLEPCKELVSTFGRLVDLIYVLAKKEGYSRLIDLLPESYLLHQDRVRACERVFELSNGSSDYKTFENETIQECVQ